MRREGTVDQTLLSESSAWISHPHRPELVDQRRATTIFAKRIRIDAAPESAVLRLTALGVVEAFLGEQRIGTDELLPGFTEYDTRVQIVEYDVSSMLSLGEQVLWCEVSDGWYAGAVGMTRAREQWGNRTALRAELRLQINGQEFTVGTDASWRSRLSSHRADMIYGEYADFQADRPGQSGDLAAASWCDVELSDGPGGQLGPAELVRQQAEPVRIARLIEPVAISQTPLGWLVDFGENIAGGIRLDRLGPRGNRLRFVAGEVQGADGEVTQQNFTPDVPFLPEPLAAGSIDEVISAGDDTVFAPRHSTKGFRFVRIEGELDRAAVERIRAQVFHSDLKKVGHFASSDDDLNWLYSATERSFLGNAIDIPTDCPSRERAGWSADWDIFFDTASYLYDVRRFTVKWLRDLAAKQWHNGIVGNMAPIPSVEGEHGPIAFSNGSAGWGDAMVSIPLKHFLRYGDVSVLEEFWPNMQRWLDFVRRQAKCGRHESRIARSATAEPHEALIWDTGFHFGEWFEPDTAELDFAALSSQDHGAIATAYFYRSSSQMAQIADHLGMTERAAELRQLSAQVRDAWRREFLDPLGRVHPARQANCVRALSFGLLEPTERAGVTQQLVELIDAAGGHLGTGFLSTGELLPVLIDEGRAEVAYSVLFQRDWPSWLRMRDLGATTVWERWEGFDELGNPVDSHNHYSKGAVTRVLFEYVAGLRRVSSSTNELIFAPQPPAALDWAEATHRFPSGLASIRWQRDGTQLLIELEVPEGVRARLRRCDGSETSVPTGRSRASIPAPLAKETQ